MSENVVKRSGLRVEICGSKYNPNLLMEWSGQRYLMKWQEKIFPCHFCLYGEYRVKRRTLVWGQGADSPCPRRAFGEHILYGVKYNVLYFTLSR